MAFKIIPVGLRKVAQVYKFKLSLKFKFAFEYFFGISRPPLFILKVKINFKGFLKPELGFKNPADWVYRQPLRVKLLIHEKN